MRDREATFVHQNRIDVPIFFPILFLKKGIILPFFPLRVSRFFSEHS